MRYRGVIGTVCALVLLIACDSPSTTTDRETRRERARWCQLCPTWCHTDLTPVPTDDLLRLYRMAAMQYGHVERTYGDAWEVLQRLTCMVKGGDVRTREAFLSLLDDDDVAVRYCVAVHALGNRFARKAPLRVLREIARGSSELAIYADIRLLNWEAGINVEL